MILQRKRWARLAIVLACVLVIDLFSAAPASASASGWAEAGNVAVDVVIVRPSFFIVTVLGATAYVVSLPITACNGTSSKAGHTLVVLPARATFTRDLGDLEGVVD